jgi:hypothetical protein
MDGPYKVPGMESYQRLIEQQMQAQNSAMGQWLNVTGTSTVSNYGTNTITFPDISGAITSGITLRPDKPDPATFAKNHLAWLDRRVDEIRVRL